MNYNISELNHPKKGLILETILFLVACKLTDFPQKQYFSEVNLRPLKIMCVARVQRQLTILLPLDGASCWKSDKIRCGFTQPYLF